MKNDVTYDLYRSSAGELEKMRPVVALSDLRLWLWRCSFALLFSMTTFTLVISFLDDEILIWIFGLFSDSKNFIRESASVFLPVYQVILLLFLIILVAINIQCIHIRKLNRHLLEQENLIRDMIDRYEEQN